MQLNNLLAYDTETSGLSIRAGCRPYAIILQEPNKNPVLFEWEMNPHTRHPIIPHGDIDDIKQRFVGKIAVGFNSKFDLLALESIGINLWEIVGWENIHDAMLLSHAYESGGSHGLKELCVRHLGLLDDDERQLGKDCVRARAIAKRLGWAIAKPGHPHFPAVKTFGEDKKAWKADMWLPRAIAQHQNRPVDDPWWTVLQNYAVLDGKRTLDLFLHLQKKVQEEGLWNQYLKNQRLIEVTYNTMERRGVSMRPYTVRLERMRFAKEAKVYAQKARDALGVPNLNLRSGDQMADLLFKTYQLPILELTDKKKPSTGADTLAKLHPIAPKNVQEFIENLIIYRKYIKGQEYLELFANSQIKSRVHCNIKITGTAVTRMSVGDPPMQTVGKLLGGREHWPSEINDALKAAGVNLRRVFGPSPGREWYALDYSQAHVRLFAWLSEDKDAQQVFNEGRDYYLFLAAGALNVPQEQVTKSQRAMFKSVALGALYGIGDAKLEKVTGMSGLRQQLDDTYPSRALYIGKVHDAAMGKGYVITPGGYRLYCPQDHKLLNYIIIGGEGEIAKKALLDCHNLLESVANGGYDPYVALQVHDELLFEFPANDEHNLPLVRQLAGLMEQSALDHGAVIPVEITKISEGTGWNEGEKLKR